MKLLFLLSALLLVQNNAYAIHLKNKEIDIQTDKVSHLDSVVDEKLALKYALEMSATYEMPGDRVIYINSPGGITEYGDDIIFMMDYERAQGVKMICVVDVKAHSMAFNILSHCDVKLSTPGARMLVHKAEISNMPHGDGTRWTANYLKEMAKELEAVDAPYAKWNRKAMHLTKAQYDRYADAETYFKPAQLKKMGYLDGIVVILNDK